MCLAPGLSVYLWENSNFPPYDVILSPVKLEGSDQYRRLFALGRNKYPISLRAMLIWKPSEIRSLWNLKICYIFIFLFGIFWSKLQTHWSVKVKPWLASIIWLGICSLFKLLSPHWSVRPEQKHSEHPSGFEADKPNVPFRQWLQ